MQRQYTRSKGAGSAKIQPDPAKTRKYLIVGILIAFAVVSTSLVMVAVFWDEIYGTGEPTGDENQDLGPAGPVLRTSGTWSAWWNLGAKTYQYVTMWVNSSTGGSSYTHKLVPDEQLPFTDRGSSVVVYETTFAGTHKFLYGVNGSKGWWLGFIAFDAYDQVTVDYLLDLSNGVKSPEPSYIVL